MRAAHVKKADSEPLEIEVKRADTSQDEGDVAGTP
jgi:hypothetical protein